jgi:hypothetical protein
MALIGLVGGMSVMGRIGCIGWCMRWFGYIGRRYKWSGLVLFGLGRMTVSWIGFDDGMDRRVVLDCLVGWEGCK